MKLSLCIPTFNEEQFIHYPLDSAYDLADEIIVIDGGSKDKTVEIAKSYGEKVRVFVVDNPPNFLLNKQRAIEKASGEWILQLDADEAVTPELKKEIISIIQNQNLLGSELASTTLGRDRSSFRSSSSMRGVTQDELAQTSTSRVNSDSEPTTYNSQPTTFSGYWIPRKNFFLGRFLMKGGVYPDRVLRLYKKEGAHFKLKDLHENIIVEGKVGQTKGALEHWADPTFERYLMRWNRYTTFDAQLLAKEKRHLGFLDFINYFWIKPKLWFFNTYFRHKGFQDGFPGFVFSLFSSIRFWAIYIKAWQQIRVEKIKNL